MATRTVNGSCHHDCPDTCGWTVTVEDGRVYGLGSNDAKAPAVAMAAAFIEAAWRAGPCDVALILAPAEPPHNA